MPARRRSAAASVTDLPPDSPPASGKPLSELFEPFVRSQAGWNADYRKHAADALAVFVSLMGDLPVSKITGEVAEAFRDRMRQLPPKRGVGIYAGMTPAQARTTAERLRTALNDPGGDHPLGEEEPFAQAGRYVCGAAHHEDDQQVPQRFITTWGAWMVAGDERSLLLHRGKCPFAGKAYSKSAIKKESNQAGRTRTVYHARGPARDAQQLPDAGTTVALTQQRCGCAAAAGEVSGPS